MGNEKIRLTVIVVVIAVLTLAAYVLLVPRGLEKHTGPRERIIFGVDVSVISAPVWVAENRGYFQSEGLDVEIRDYPSGRTALADMLEKGNLDIVTVAQTPVMYNSFSRDNYAITAAMACSYEDVLMLARGERGIRTSADLQGKKIGTPAGSSGHFFLGLFLIHSGLKISDVTVLDIDAPNLPAALAEGRVDAIAVWQPHIHNAQKLMPGKTNLLPSKNIYREDFYLVPTKDFIKKKPAALKKFLKAVDRAEKFIREKRDEAVNIVSRRLKIDRDTVDSFWNSYEFRLFLDQTVLTALEAEARWAIQNKFTPALKVPDYLEFIYADALLAIKPEAVNIIR
jgi:NitT/TauT family transport system substrate-binding protein